MTLSIAFIQQFLKWFYQITEKCFQTHNSTHWKINKLINKCCLFKKKKEKKKNLYWFSYLAPLRSFYCQDIAPFLLIFSRMYKTGDICHFICWKAYVISIASWVNTCFGFLCAYIFLLNEIFSCRKRKPHSFVNHKWTFLFPKTIKYVFNFKKGVLS